MSEALVTALPFFIVIPFVPALAWFVVNFLFGYEILLKEFYWDMWIELLRGKEERR